MRAKPWFAIGLLLTSSIFASDPQLARDVEALRNSLPLKDPARPTLTLRLADILFDQSVALSDDTLASEAQKQQAAALRKKTLALYEEALKGTPYHAGVKGALAYKIQFQMARLLQDGQQVVAANQYWQELVKQEELKDLRREAALRLAEYYEKRKTPAALKEADVYYRLSIELCGEGDVCAYGHYRRAWALREAGQLGAAIQEMQVALFDSKGQVRDEALRDLLVFLAAEKTDGEKALLLVEKLAEQTRRPSLFEELAEAFYSAGNRVAGTRALEHVNQRQPSLNHQIRLLEEYYGLRQWDKFRLVLDQAAQSAVPVEGAGPKTEKLLRRLSVQLDGERASNAQYVGEFKSVVLLYLHLFPNNPDRFKMMEGWLAAESDSAAKMKKIEEWVSEPQWELSKKEQIKLREIRIALAIKAKDSAIVEAESSKLAALVSDPRRVREYHYIQSVALKELGRTEDALKLLAEWAKPSLVQDTWTFRGGLLQVDILVEKKLYSEIATVSDQWLESPEVQAYAKTAGEKKIWKEGLALLQRVREEARFEVAAEMGEKPEALRQFEAFCYAGKYLPKSCENARVLAVKLKDQKALLDLLKAMNRKSELLAEYEASGYFNKAAELQESDLGPNSEEGAYLKVALLYELGHRFTDRNRILNALMAKLQKRKAIGEQENVIFATLQDAHLLDPKALDLPWSENNRLKLANQLELEGKGSAQTKKQLLASPRSAGAAWSRYVLEELAERDRVQRKIRFYGRNGQTKFKARLKAMNALDAAAEKYFAGADVGTRSRIAILLAKSYRDFANEILNSPTPAELSAELLAEVKASLVAMAEPFQKKTVDYEKLAHQQLAEMPLSERAALEALLLPDTEPTLIAKVDPPQSKSPAALAPEKEVAYQDALGQLHRDPLSAAALNQIKAFYESQGKERLASYFQGRLLQLEPKKGGEP